MNKVKYKILGMDCPSCAIMLECDLKDAGCMAKCSYAKSTLEIEGEHDLKVVKKIAKKSGCYVSPIE